jgi:Ser/Thr protein kinase RdoA (MazF antagonist)
VSSENPPQQRNKPLSRFEMPSYPKKVRAIEALLQKWNIEQIDTIQPTSEGGGRTWFIVTISAGEYVLKASNLVKSTREYKYLSSLSKTGIPVALPLKTIAGDWHVENDNQKIYCLYPKLPGKVITEHYGGGAHRRAKGFGQALGLLHSQFRKMDGGSNREMDFVGQIQNWAIAAVEKANTFVNAPAITKIWEAIEPELISLCEEVPLQLIHRDAHTSNMLFDEGNLTGFLDFEMVTRGLPLFDICYCGSCLLVSGFENPDKGRKWPTLFHSLLSGYQELCSLTPREHKSIYAVMIGIELIFLAFWVDNNNIKFTKQTENLLFWLENNKGSLKNLKTT